MKIRELRDLGTAELEAKVLEFQQELFNLRFQQATKQLENTKRIANVKKAIARCKTLLAQRKRELLVASE